MSSIVTDRAGTDVSGLVGRGAADLAALVREGRATAVDVARAHLARIAEVDEQVGAFQILDPERVLAEAAGVDARPNRFALPLAGVPVAVKDDIDVSGFPTRHGCPASPDQPARRDDDLVKRLRAAGAVVIGKTRMPELGVWGAATRTRNPVDVTLDPGGSCGGAAAAVAAGMAALALATDGGGSIRLAAACCELVGLTPGDGVVPLPGGTPQEWFGRSVAGPVARTAIDAALMMNALSGNMIGDLTAAGIPGRVAVSLRSPAPRVALRAPQRDAVLKAARRFAESGVCTVDADPPYPATLAGQWTRHWLAGVAHDAGVLGLDLADLQRRTAAVVRRGRRVLRAGPPAAGVAATWRDRFVGWLDGGRYDVLLLPAVAGAPEAAGPVGVRPGLRGWAAAAGRVSYTQAWNLAGLPAVVVPVRWGATRVPVQLVGRPGAEALLLATAARLEHG